MSQFKAVILSNENQDDHFPWIKACETYNEKVNYRVVNLTCSDWLDEINRLPFDVLLAKPGGISASFKQLYDERIYILSKVLGYNLFPTAEEIFLYENKRFLSYWLKANHIPHPFTNVFYDRKEAMKFVENSIYPLVAKTNIGASGSGVVIITTKEEAYNYIRLTYSGKGAPRRSGPNFSKGDWFTRGFHYIMNPRDIFKKLEIYKTVKSDIQTDFIILQEYIDHDFEWRVIRIGESFFAHKKLKVGDKASGTLLKSYENPPLTLLNFVKEITDHYGFFSQAVDIFEKSDGSYLINELQCIFGQSDLYQMKVDGAAGRYRYLSGQWNFEKGDFAQNACYNLRLEMVLSQLNSE